VHRDLGAALGLINFNIDERINPRLRTFAVVRRSPKSQIRKASAR
jgi:peptide/nickel transport system permease protein